MPTNRLALEKSPYLLQHAHNPVDWYPWGDEAFEKASGNKNRSFCRWDIPPATGATSWNGNRLKTKTWPAS